jgi:hypothetical protein
MIVSCVLLNVATRTDWLKGAYWTSNAEYTGYVCCKCTGIRIQYLSTIGSGNFCIGVKHECEVREQFSPYCPETLESRYSLYYKWEE